MDLQTGTIEKNCRERGDIAAYLDGELAPAEELALEAHVAQCKDCLEELNLQKQMLAALDFDSADKPEIQLPEDFAKIVAVRAESGVCGLRSREERLRALFLCGALFLFGLTGLGIESVFAILENFLKKALALASFTGHLIYDLTVGTIVILRSLTGQFGFDSAFSLIAFGGLLVVSAALLSRSISRFGRSREVSEVKE